MRRSLLRPASGALGLLAVLAEPGSVTVFGAPAYRSGTDSPPIVAREYRAAWVATVNNIDWPSRRGLATGEQQKELLAILDKASDLKLNLIIFQVRPGCDALYASKIEPWSEYLTGTMGRAPEPFWDPLEFAVREAHKRGLELHAWFNPYRARHASARSPIAPKHISQTRPNLVRKYGGYLWLDPGEKEVRDYSLRVVMDVVSRYDVDGVHFDDYFYPYKNRDSSGQEVDFPDEESWRRYGAATQLSRNDWRRENVNVFIEGVYRSLKEKKPWVKFGISPFGIWRPGHPQQIKGLDQYDSLYADARKWLQRGWCDYFAPQLYWAIEPPDQSFPVLLKWWAQQNEKSRLILPGLDATKVRRVWEPEEIVNQIQLARQQPGIAGHVHWNMGSLLRNPRLTDALTREVYKQPALPPAFRWLDSQLPAKPRFSVSGNSMKWERGAGEMVALWLLHTKSGGQWSTRVLPGETQKQALPSAAPETLALTAVDRCGNLGPPAILTRR